MLTDILRDVRRALEDPILQESVSRAAASNEENVARVLSHYPELAKLAREVEEAKKRVLSRLDEYIEATMESLRRVKARPYFAENGEEARELIARVVGSNKLVVMSKSMVAEEIGLREYLEMNGNEVWETDLGQLLVQLEGGKPMHTLAPAIHMSKDAAAKLLSEKLGLAVSSSSPDELVASIREFLRAKLTRADVGITGANAIAADTGAVLLVENEGNIRLVAGMPRKHIVVAGVDKILPSLVDAFKAVIVQSAYAGLYPPTYVNITAGPSSTADIELQRVYGVHGPPEVHVVLVDNGRREAARHSVLSEQLRCIRCGRCQLECPVWQHTANNWGGRVYGGPMGLGWTAITEDMSRAAAAAMLCLLCKRCDSVCPMRIPLSRIARWLKRYYVCAFTATEKRQP
ncbi:MAG TPA: lactate utilization protein [Pyrodictium delaneyi]|uniref:Lactate utilization protein n=1 Tax=Pyrodictium delaneyi TaxID=1273541 RepID=A0A832ZS12_9CREN|nr:lactate utilization protein [Pyrodictium delaneyi]